MGIRNTWRLTISSVGLIALGACGGDPSGPREGDTGSSDWSCSDETSVTTCTAVSALQISSAERELYTCGASEGGLRCPPAALGGDDDWACIAVRLDLTCQRLMVPSDSGGDENPGEDPPGGGDENPGSGGADVTPPNGCDPGAWKDYFVALANDLFADSGIDLGMTNSDLKDQMMIEGPPPGLGDKPECGPIIGLLQQGSWLAVVMEGCGNLNMHITAWCQNTHTFAAEEGVCNYGAGW